mgnify:FL=1
MEKFLKIQGYFCIVLLPIWIWAISLSLSNFWKDVSSNQRSTLRLRNKWLRFTRSKERSTKHVRCIKVLSISSKTIRFLSSLDRYTHAKASMTQLWCTFLFQLILRAKIFSRWTLLRLLNIICIDQVFTRLLVWTIMLRWIFIIFWRQTQTLFSVTTPKRYSLKISDKPKRLIGSELFSRN